MEKAVFGMETLNVTQGMNNSFSHKGTLAIDIAGKDSGIESIKAPFTGVIKRIYKGYVVWLESTNKVKYADGTEDYMTVMLMHDNDTTDLKVGQTIKQGQIFYQEGTTGYATGNHIHLACGKGKYTGNGWYENSNGNWCINNQYDVTKALFILDSCKIKNAGGYNWVKTNTLIVDNITKNVERDENMEQVEVLVEQLRVRKEPNLKGDILGYAKKAIYNVLDKKEADGYLWFKIAENQWIATSEEQGWTKYYPATNYEKLYKEADEKIKLLEAEVSALKEKIEKAIKDLA